MLRDGKGKGGTLNKNEDIEKMIVKYARAKRVSKRDFPEFRQRVLAGLKRFGIRTDKIDLPVYVEVAKRIPKKIMQKVVK